MAKMEQDISPENDSLHPARQVQLFGRLATHRDEDPFAPDWPPGSSREESVPPTSSSRTGGREPSTVPATKGPAQRQGRRSDRHGMAAPQAVLTPPVRHGPPGRSPGRGQPSRMGRGRRPRRHRRCLGRPARPPPPVGPQASDQGAGQDAELRPAQAPDGEVGRRFGRQVCVQAGREGHREGGRRPGGQGHRGHRGPGEGRRGPSSEATNRPTTTTPPGPVVT